MESVAKLCRRVIRDKTYDKESITKVVNSYYKKGMLTPEELAEMLLLIEESYGPDVEE